MILFLWSETIAQDCSGFSALARHLRHTEDGGKYKEGSNLQEEAEAYDKALVAAAAKAGLRFSKGSYVRPHLLRKHLILLDYKSNDLCRKARRLSLPKLLALNLPDEQGHLKTISSYLAKREMLGSVFRCHTLFLSCFSCLARVVLQQHGTAALTYVEDPENYPRIAEVLVQYRQENHCNPSLERLFQLLLGHADQQNAQLTASSETEAEQEAKPKQQARVKGRKRSLVDRPEQPAKSGRKGLEAAASKCRPFADKLNLEPATSGGGSSSSSRPMQFSSADGTAKPAFRRLAASSATVILDLAEEDDLPLVPRQKLRSCDLQE